MPSAERWPYSSSGTSFQVMTAWTPGIDSAFVVSSFVIPAWWAGERSALAQSVPGMRTSSTYVVRPVTWATPS